MEIICQMEIYAETLIRCFHTSSKFVAKLFTLFIVNVNRNSVICFATSCPYFFISPQGYGVVNHELKHIFLPKTPISF